MLLDKDLLAVTANRSIADNEQLIKTNTINVQDNTFTVSSSSKQPSISPLTRSIDSKSIRCQKNDDKTVPDNSSTNILIKCKGEVSTDNQGLQDATISDGNETINTGLVERSMENDAGAMPTSGMDITVEGLDSNLQTVHLVVLYHMMWCIGMKIVKDPPGWPFADVYKACQSPIYYPESNPPVMQFMPPLRWLNAHASVQVLVTESFLSDIAWCAQYEFELEQIMYFSFHNLVKHCVKTEKVADNYDFIGGGPDKPPMSYVRISVVGLFHIVWCVQRDSLPFKGLPISYQELLSCQSPLIPVNKGDIHSNSLEWWASSKSVGKQITSPSSIFFDLIKCARNKLFVPDDMTNTKRMFDACSKITNHPINIATSDPFANTHTTKTTYTTTTSQEHMLKPIYTYLGIIILLFKSLSNFMCYSS